jgi:hypothetical protein
MTHAGGRAGQLEKYYTPHIKAKANAKPEATKQDPNGAGPVQLIHQYQK